MEERVPIYQVFVNITKAFDTVNRSALWIILEKLGCPSGFVDLLKQLHRNMKVRVNFNGSLSEPISIDNGVKQGDIPAPTLFSIYCAVTLAYALVFTYVSEHQVKSSTYDVSMRSLRHSRP